MRSPKRILPKGTQSFDTELELDIQVQYSMSAPEPDVGCAGGVEIEGVYVGGMAITVSDEQEESLANQILEDHQSAYEAACDNAYDLRKDES